MLNFAVTIFLFAISSKNPGSTVLLIFVLKISRSRLFILFLTTDEPTLPDTITASLRDDVPPFLYRRTINSPFSSALSCRRFFIQLDFLGSVFSFVFLPFLPKHQ